MQKKKMMNKLIGLKNLKIMNKKNQKINSKIMKTNFLEKKMQIM